MDKFNIMVNKNYELVNTGIYKPARNSYFASLKFHFFRYSILEQFIDKGSIFDADDLLLALYTYFAGQNVSINYKMISSFFDEKNNIYTFNFKYYINENNDFGKPKVLLAYQKIYQRKKL